MPETIQTSRSVLRPVSLDDFDFLKKMGTDPAIMAHIGSGTVRTTEQSKTALDRNLALRRQNPLLGQWVIREKSSGQDIGTFVVRPPATLEKLDALEIGFVYVPETWGKGFATETAKAMIQYVQRHFPGKKIIGIVDPQNEASKQVLSKIGMKQVGATTYVNPINGDEKECILMEWDEPLHRQS